MTEPLSESDRIFQAAAGPDHYPAWLYMGGSYLTGAGDRLVACFRPCSVPRFADEE